MCKGFVSLHIVGTSWFATLCMVLKSTKWPRLPRYGDQGEVPNEFERGRTHASAHKGSGTKEEKK